MVFADVVAPSAPWRSVIVTMAVTLPGLTIATPRLRDRRALEEAKSTVWVVITPARTLACVASAASPEPNVSKTTNPLGEPGVWARTPVERQTHNNVGS